jgi:hypothetical protein
MLRWACLLIAMTACARSGPPPARLFAEGAGECPDAGGCGVPLGEEAKYAPPDEGHELPGEPNLGPEEARAATCTDVGIAAASLEVGNYASEQERAPILTKYRGRCRTVRLDQAERQCVFEAADAVAIAYCAPRFWPEQALDLVDVSACAGIASEIRARGNALPDAPDGQAIWERQLMAVQRSCEQDRWTITFGECARTMAVASYVAPYCQHVAPAQLVMRLQDRMAKVK